MTRSFEESLKRVARLHGLQRECELSDETWLQSDKGAWFADRLTRLYREELETAMRTRAGARHSALQTRTYCRDRKVRF